MPFEDFHVTPRSDDEIERIALALRVALGSGDEWAPDMLALLERAGRAKSDVTGGLEVVPVSNSEAGNRQAWADFDPPRIYVEQSVFIAAKQGEPRAHMTLAHELGHIVLHPGAPKARMVHRNLTAKFIRPANSVERQASCSLQPS